MLYEIRHRYTGELLYSHDGGSLKEAVVKAVAERKDLRRAYLRDADLSGAYLRDAYLRDADLSGADLRDADLSGADLDIVRNDLWAVLLYAPNEVPALIAALDAGRVNGSVYRDDCNMGCLVGTLAIARDCADENGIQGLWPDSSRPAERWFLGIKKGDTPETNKMAKLAREWCQEFVERIGVVPGRAALRESEKLREKERDDGRVPTDR